MGIGNIDDGLATNPSSFRRSGIRRREAEFVVGKPVEGCLDRVCFAIDSACVAFFFVGIDYDGGDGKLQISFGARKPAEKEAFALEWMIEIGSFEEVSNRRVEFAWTSSLCVV